MIAKPTVGMLLLALALAGCGQAGMASVPLAQARGAAPVVGQAIPGRALFALKPGAHATLRPALAAKLTPELPALGLYAVDLGGNSLADLKADLGANARYVGPDTVVSLADSLSTLASAAPPLQLPGFGFSDPQAGQQWAIPIVHQAEAIQATRGGAAQVTIAIVDSGVDLDHPDLKNNLVKGYNDTGLAGALGLGKPKDGNGHGTHCAGIAAAIANNGLGIVGMAPNCKIMPVKVLGDDGQGSLSSVAKGVVWAADHGADVISLSLGASSTTPALADAIAYALKKNVVVVSAMGNAGEAGNPIAYPAAYPGVIAVGATDENDRPAPFTSFNSYCSVAAPGVDIYSCMPTYPVYLTENSQGTISENYATLSGTSMAAPLVAGLCALIRSEHPGLAPAEIKQRLEATADRVPAMGGLAFESHLGHGRLNAQQAVSL